MNWDSDYGSSSFQSVYEQFSRYWPRNGRWPERNFKSDDQDTAMDKAQTKAEDATLLDPALEDNEPDEDREQFRHFTDPNVDSLYTGAGPGYE